MATPDTAPTGPQQTTDAAPTEPKRMKRRGLIAGAASLAAAGVMAKSLADAAPVSANQGTFTLPYVANLATDAALFYLFNGGTGHALFGSGDKSDGIVGQTNASTSSAGVVGVGNGGLSAGVVGHGSPSRGGGTGVVGTSGTGIGVRGNSDASTAIQGDATAGTAVEGRSGHGIGVFGGSIDGTAGVFGAVSTGSGLGVLGVVNSSGAAAIAGNANATGATAGQFFGPVNIFNNPNAPNAGNLFVQGNQTISGTKSAAVPHPDGSHRLLYCVESPEAWFEDFGEGTITGGRAEVKLDADFAAVVDTAKLHVFITEHGENHNLHLAGTSAVGFTVAASAGALAARGIKAADVNGTFTYRVVAKRKDVNAGRLAKFEVPKEINAPSLPKEITSPAPLAPIEPPVIPAMPKQ